MINSYKLKLFGLETIWELKPNETNPEAIFCEMFGRAEIVGKIPRFVKSKENYSSNFGYQWLKFAKTQLDSSSGIPLTRDRFFNDTQWTMNELKGKRVLEVGSGAGRFTEILLSTGALFILSIIRLPLKPILQIILSTKICSCSKDRCMKSLFPTIFLILFFALAFFSILLTPHWPCNQW